MNRPRKEIKTAQTLLSITIRRIRCALFASYFFIATVFAQDVPDTGLFNPAERDFGMFQALPRSPENFTRKTPAFNDRTIPAPPQSAPPTEPIRQVSTTIDDPFPSVVHPSQQAFSPPGNVSDWPIVPPDTLQYQPMLQHNAGQYHFGYYDPQTLLAMQNMQQFHTQQYAMQQQVMTPHGFMLDGVNPYTVNPLGMNPYGDPYAGMMLAQQNQFAQNQFAQNPFGQINPYGMPPLQDMQMFMMQQESARQQAIGQSATNNTAKDADNAADVTGTENPNWSFNNLVPLRVSSPLGETMLVCMKTISPFNTPSGPDKGVGMPLAGKSWLDHPYYFGGFVGVMCGSQLVSGMINQDDGAHGGLTFGYNFNDYWGLESRFHFAAIDIRDTAYARELFLAAWEQDNPGMIAPPNTTRTNELTILDVAVHYYPLGNAKWRPYFKYGLGIGRQKFVNTFGFQESSDIFTMPLGLGLRYWWNERLAIQMDLNNNTIFSSGSAKTQNNVSFTIGLTYAFGNGRRTAPVHYWPATPSLGSRW